MFEYGKFDGLSYLLKSNILLEQGTCICFLLSHCFTFNRELNSCNLVKYLLFGSLEKLSGDL